MEQSTSKDINQILISTGCKVVSIRLNVSVQLLVEAKITHLNDLYIHDIGAGTAIIDFKQSEIFNLCLKIPECKLTSSEFGDHSLEYLPSIVNINEKNNVKIDKISMALMSLSSAWESTCEG